MHRSITNYNKSRVLRVIVRWRCRVAVNNKKNSIKKIKHMGRSVLYSLAILVYCVKLEFVESSQKNVLVMIADDYGFESGIYGNPVVPTPNIDGLAKKGRVFHEAYSVVSSCSPSRSAILTGLPPHQNGMYGLHNGYHAFNSFSKVKSLPLILNSANINTGIIGKKHVGPDEVYPFKYSKTEEHNEILQVGRNITNMKNLVSEFLNKQSEDNPFMLYVGFHDPHRCGRSNQQYGVFCEKFGNGQKGMGLIPDWKPFYIETSKVIVPNFVQDTPKAREDIAAQYTTISRLDQGVGLVLKEFEIRGLLNNTLIIFTSDNGIPFLNGRTNLYRSGIKVPFILSSYDIPPSESSNFITLLDITPTILDWFNLPYPDYKIFGNKAILSGQSLFKSEPIKYAFASHSLHEITMYYPMRSIISSKFHLIHNLNSLMPYPIDQDFYLSPSFQDVLNRTKHGVDLHWFKTLREYYYRKEWELYEYSKDNLESKNLAYEPEYDSIFRDMKKQLNQWQNFTNDPFICAPSAVLEDGGIYKSNHHCFPLYNNNDKMKIIP